MIFCCQKLQFLWGVRAFTRTTGVEQPAISTREEVKGCFLCFEWRTARSVYCQEFCYFFPKRNSSELAIPVFQMLCWFQEGYHFLRLQEWETLAIQETRVRSSKLLMKFELRHMPPGNDIFINICNCIIYIIYIYINNCNPNDRCFDLKRPCFGRFNHQNRGQTGSRYIDTP